MQTGSTAKPKVEILPTGSYFDVDAEGYIINPASAEKIQPEWQPVLDAAIATYQKRYGEKLRHVVLRGSVAKGQAIEGVSDVDTFAYVDLPKEEISNEWANVAEAELVARFPFASQIEIGAYPMSDIAKDAVMLNQAVVIWGDPIAVPKLKIGRDLALHAPRIHKRLAFMRKFLSESQPESEIKSSCTWLAKGILRAGLELSMERAGRYSRDLYRCYETFIQVYPQKGAEMREALHLALNPTADIEIVRGLVEGIGAWIEGEAKVVWPERV
jgi:hypothetical protein